jgi:NAD-dependent DNA ligase
MALVPNLDFYLQNDLNILLSGAHGVGKTYVLVDACKRLGLNFKYYSCATLDPFTDLVGVPYPIDDPNLQKKVLSMVRFHEMDSADVILFDELNRAQDTKTLNAVLEIVQFRSINGERLKNLKCVLAAVNPPTEEYQVEELDPALIDRFDLFFEVKPNVDVSYLESVGIPKKVAQAFKKWWGDNQKDKKSPYISPRRIEKMAQMVVLTGDNASIKNMFPLGYNFAVGELVDLLNIATGKTVIATGRTGPADSNFTYDPNGLLSKLPQLVAHLQNNPTQNTINEVVKVLSSGIGSYSLAFNYGQIIEVLPPTAVEGMIAGWNPSKRSTFKTEWADALAANVVSVREPWATNGVTPAPSTMVLSGQNIVVSGTIPNHTRGTAETYLKGLGASTTGSVRATTTLLVTGTSPGASKLRDARNRNIQAIHWNDLENFIRGLDKTMNTYSP